MDGIRCGVAGKCLSHGALDAARAVEEFVRRNETMPPAYTENLEGFRMDETHQGQDVAATVSEPSGELEVLWVGLPVLGLLLAWRIRRRR